MSAIDQAAMVALAKQKAINHGVDPALLCAVAEQESEWNPYAIRFERAWAVKLMGNPAIIGDHISPPSKETEIAQRSFSWGLMQVLGQTAREHVYTYSFLTQLCDPEIGLEFGAMILADKLRIAKGDTRQALLFYNGGGDKTYPEQVLARMKNYVGA